MATNFALTAVENKIPDGSNLDKKQIEIQKLMSLKRILLIIIMKYIITPEFNKLTAETFAARLAQSHLVTKTDFDTNLKSLNQDNALLVEKWIKNTTRILLNLF